MGRASETGGGVGGWYEQNEYRILESRNLGRLCWTRKLVLYYMIVTLVVLLRYQYERL